MKIEIEKVKFKVKILEDENWKAIVTVDFGIVSIKGFRIKTSEYMGNHGEFLWVTPPCHKSAAGYKSIVHFNKDIWRELEKGIIGAYKEKFEEYTVTKMNGVRATETDLP